MKGTPRASHAENVAAKLAAALFFAASFSAWLARGVPFIPPALIPMFLTVPLFSLSEVPGNSLEIGELLFAVSVLLWSFENARRHWMVDREGPGAMLRGGLVLVAIPLVLTIGATAAFHMENQLRKRLNQYAAVTYPKLEMFAQAQEVYRYIFANPIYVTADTRLSYATMLIANGAVCDGLAQLARTVGSIERDIGADGASASDLRRLASAYALMGKDDLARETFDRAIELDRRSLAAATDPNGLTPILWSLSKSFRAMGDLDEALASAEAARRRAASASERWALDRWIGSLKWRIRDRDEEADGAAESVRAFAPTDCAGPAP